MRKCAHDLLPMNMRENERWHNTQQQKYTTKHSFAVP